MRNCKTASAQPKPRKDFMTHQRQEILPDAGEKDGQMRNCNRKG